MSCSFSFENIVFAASFISIDKSIVDFLEPYFLSFESFLVSDMFLFVNILSLKPCCFRFVFLFFCQLAFFLFPFCWSHVSLQLKVFFNSHLTATLLQIIHFYLQFQVTIFLLNSAILSDFTVVTIRFNGMRNFVRMDCASFSIQKNSVGPSEKSYLNNWFPTARRQKLKRIFQSPKQRENGESYSEWCAAGLKRDRPKWWFHNS